MAISLSGMASGLDTDSIISPVDGDRAEQGHRRPEAPGLRHAAQDGPQRHQDQARRGQDRRQRPVVRVAVEAGADHHVLGPDEGRRRPCSAAPASAATRSRSTASPPRRSTASPTRPSRQRRQAHASPTAATPTIVDRHRGQRQRDRDRHRHRRSTPTTRRRSTPPWSRRAASSASSSPRARPATTRDFTRRHVGTGRPAAMAERRRLQARRARPQRRRSSSTACAPTSRPSPT